MSAPVVYHHLLLIEDGQRRENQLFTSRRELAEYLMKCLSSGEYVDVDEYREVLREQDEEALQADYPEGVSPGLPDPEDRISMLADWLQTFDLDLYTDVLSAPTPKEGL